MKKIIEHIGHFSFVIMAISISVQIYNLEKRLDYKIENTIERLMPMKPVPDTARIIIAPPINKIGDYHYFIGKTSDKSKKFINQFDYNLNWPREIWDGYLTPVKCKNGAEYWVWSENEIPGNIEMSFWAIAGDDHSLEIGYHKKTKDKVYTKILYPIVGIHQNKKSIQ